ncbi:MAG: S41 family peptidase [Clostridiales bacterium]|nr:S41 family peptidase [Clostridiales bacterium]
MVENETRTKNKFWKGMLVGSLVTAFAILLVVGIAAGISLIGHSVIGSGSRLSSVGMKDAGDEDSLDLDFVNRKLQVLKALIDRDFLFEENIDGEAMETGIYKGMLEALGDPYTVYYTSDEYKALTEETEGVYCGIGALVSQNMETGVVTILRVFKNSPAEEAGVQKGDIILKVNDVEYNEMDLDMLVSQEIRGEEGTWVDILIQRDNEQLTLHIERRQVEATTVEYQMLEQNTGYIMVSQFEIVTSEQFINAIDDLVDQGMEQLIIDLRDNPGGVLSSTVEMAAYILPEGQWDGMIVSTADKNGHGFVYYSEDGEIRYASNSGDADDPAYPKEDGHELDMPIVILVNGNSASASEVFSGALQDYGVAKLVGTTTFGKGIVQGLVPLTDGSAVKLTISHYYTPSGFDLHSKGLTPDVEVELEIPEDIDLTLGLPLDQDNQVQAALETLGVR